MKRLIIKEIATMLGRSLLLALIVTCIIVAIGYVRMWDSPIRYSNAFFLAGSILMIGGGFSHYTAGTGLNSLQQISAESFRGMSSSEQAIFISNASRSVSALILGVVTGLILMILSAITGFLL